MFPLQIIFKDLNEIDAKATISPTHLNKLLGKMIHVSMYLTEEDESKETKENCADDEAVLCDLTLSVRLAPPPIFEIITVYRN